MVSARISELERHVLEHVRRLTAHGFGSLRIEFRNHKVEQILPTLADDVELLKKVQEAQK